jgi:hypothetical protein
MEQLSCQFGSDINLAGSSLVAFVRFSPTASPCELTVQVSGHIQVNLRWMKQQTAKLDKVLTNSPVIFFESAYFYV